MYRKGREHIYIGITNNVLAKRCNIHTIICNYYCNL